MVHVVAGYRTPWLFPQAPLVGHTQGVGWHLGPSPLPLGFLLYGARIKPDRGILAAVGDGKYRAKAGDPVQDG
jgi:hypothetical protein